PLSATAKWGEKVGEGEHRKRCLAWDKFRGGGCSSGWADTTVSVDRAPSNCLQSSLLHGRSRRHDGERRDGRRASINFEVQYHAFETLAALRLRFGSTGATSAI